MTKVKDHELLWRVREILGAAYVASVKCDYNPLK
jgi:hypothetical protein